MLYMHQEGRIANRDIKPDTCCFITQDGGTDRKGDRAQIADFTTAIRIPKDDPEFKVSDTAGTPVFLAPEANGAAFKPLPLDVWALGISIYALVFGRLPFHGSSLHELKENIETKEPLYDLPVAFSDEKDSAPEISEGLLALLSSLLTKDPAKRPTIAEAIEKHDWLKLSPSG